MTPAEKKMGDTAWETDAKQQNRARLRIEELFRLHGIDLTKVRGERLLKIKPKTKVIDIKTRLPLEARLDEDC